MPRKARIDAPGAVNHIIARGIGSQNVFNDDADRSFFVDRLGKVLTETETHCYAWALVPNHIHLLIKTGDVPLATVMQRLLTGYALYYNRRHRRNGHLFQNRFKSILCQEDPYLLELVRYIHLNPLRANQVSDMGALDRYPYSGHSVLMGHAVNSWQHVYAVLERFGRVGSGARRRYREFVQKGVAAEKQRDFHAAEWVRGKNGWLIDGLPPDEGAYQKEGARILGDRGFVRKTLDHNQEVLDRRTRLQCTGADVEELAARIAKMVGVDRDAVLAPGKAHKVVRARSLLCYWATRELGVSQVWLSGKLGISQSAVSQAVARGRRESKRHHHPLVR